MSSSPAPAFMAAIRKACGDAEQALLAGLISWNVISSEERTRWQVRQAQNENKATGTLLMGPPGGPSVEQFQSGQPAKAEAEDAPMSPPPLEAVPEVREVREVREVARLPMEAPPMMALPVPGPVGQSVQAVIVTGKRKGGPSEQRSPKRKRLSKDDKQSLEAKWGYPVQGVFRVLEGVKSTYNDFVQQFPPTPANHEPATIAAYHNAIEKAGFPVDLFTAKHTKFTQEKREKFYHGYDATIPPAIRANMVDMRYFADFSTSTRALRTALNARNK